MTTASDGGPGDPDSGYRVDLVLVEQLCRQATNTNTNTNTSDAGGRDGVDDGVRAVTGDPLDHSIWIRLASTDAAGLATTALIGYGLAVTASDSDTIHVTGWDSRLLRRRLGTLLAGIDDLSVEWEATAELATYFYDRHAAGGPGDGLELPDVLAELEASLRTATPLPRQAPAVTDVTSLLELIDAARDSYQQLLAEHVALAETILTGYRAALASSDPATARTAARDTARSYRHQREPRP